MILNINININIFHVRHVLSFYFVIFPYFCHYFGISGIFVTISAFLVFLSLFRHFWYFCQVAFLAPTRVLALQHLRVLRTRMPDVNIQLLRGGGKGDALKVKEMIKNGECEVWYGIALP